MGGETMAMAESNALSAAQRAALRRLVADGVLSAEQEHAVMLAVTSAAPPRPARPGWLVEAAGYLGGGLVLAGAGLFLNSSWQTMTRPTRALVLAGFAAVFALAAIMIGGGPASVRRLAERQATARQRIVGVLLALAPVPAGFAVGVGLGERAAPIAGAVAFVVALAGYLLLPTAPGVVAITATSWNTVVTLGDQYLSPLTTGLLCLGLAAVWYTLAISRVVRPRPLVLALGLAIALIGAQSPQGQPGSTPWAYGLTAAVALACFLLYHRIPELVLLVGGVLSATLAVPEAVFDLTNGALGGPAILLVTGAALLIASGIGLRLRTSDTRHRTRHP
jgi:hypothetical protein